MRLRSRESLILALEDSGMSERELARRADLSHSTVNHLVTSRRSTCSLHTALAIEMQLAAEAGSLFEAESDAEQQMLAQYVRSLGRKRSTPRRGS
jgi:DNA-binding CsgD family transcriptional regulator